MPQHGMGYCTIAQPATGKLGTHKSLPSISTSSHRLLSTRSVSEALEAQDSPKVLVRGPNGYNGSTPTHPPPTPSLPQPAGSTWRSGSLYPDLLKPVGGTACHLPDTQPSCGVLAKSWVRGVATTHTGESRQPISDRTKLPTVWLASAR